MKSRLAPAFFISIDSAGNAFPATWLTFVTLAASVIALWLPWRFTWAALCAIAVIVGYVAGVLSGPAVAPIAALAAACWAYHRQREHPAFPGAKLLFGLIIVAVLLLLGFNVFPGFHHPVYVKDLMLSPGAKLLTRSLTFEVWIVGVLILGLCHREFIHSGNELREAPKRAWPVIVGNVAILIPLALALGFVRFDPKWTGFFWMWAALQLCFTILTQEAFFSRLHPARVGHGTGTVPLRHVGRNRHRGRHVRPGAF